MTKKKEYTAPVLKSLGNVEDLTKGFRKQGPRDQWFGVTFGHRQPRPTDRTSG